MAEDAGRIWCPLGAIQKLSQDTVNTKNLYSPLGDPTEGVKENGQYIMTEIRYSEVYPNSFLDIIYPNADTAKQRPTLIYFHGGGFFGGSKSVGDPLAGSDATALLDDLCAEGFNLVNIDYALVPEYHFPVPLIQANMAFQFLMEHAEEYHLDMNRVVIMGSSAGAIMTSQLGSIITNPAYAQLLEIEPALQPEQVKALVIDDAPLDYEHFSLGTKVLVGNYIQGSIFVSKDEVRRYNNIGWIDANYPPCVLLGSDYHADLRLMDAALTDTSVKHDLSGKRLIPFNTHESSGQGRTISEIAASAPNAEMLDGIAIQGKVAQEDDSHTRELLTEWLGRIILIH